MDLKITLSRIFIGINITIHVCVCVCVLSSEIRNSGSVLFLKLSCTTLRRCVTFIIFYYNVSCVMCTKETPTTSRLPSHKILS